MSIEIERTLLEKSCIGIIETILLCLPDAFKGTIYRIGKPPDLIAERITSGVIDRDRNKISWGLPAKSDYNTPGKARNRYMDQPGSPLEAMAWCVERQKSWTAEDPENDARTIRPFDNLQPDFYHMEPVLVHKSDLRLDLNSFYTYPLDYYGSPIWTDTDYVVVAVIKIHFHPYTINIGSPKTKVIKKLSRSLGTELLSYQLHRYSIMAMEKLARDRLNACNILADSLRNATAKSGMIFSLIKQEIGCLREQWEKLLLKELNASDMKMEAISDLSEMLEEIGGDYKALRDELAYAQNSFLNLFLPGKKGENWVVMQIEGRWKNLLCKSPADDKKEREVWENIDKLKRSLHFGKNPQVIADYKKIPNNFKKDWVDILYKDYERFDASDLERLINFLSNPLIPIPSKEKSRKKLSQLKALAETMSQLERNTNFLLAHVLNGGEKKIPENITSCIRNKSLIKTNNRYEQLNS